MSGHIPRHDFQWLWDRISDFGDRSTSKLIISVKSREFLSNRLHFCQIPKLSLKYYILSMHQVWYCSPGWHQIGSGCSLNFCQQLWISVKSNFCQNRFCQPRCISGKFYIIWHHIFSVWIWFLSNLNFRFRKLNL